MASRRPARSAACCSAWNTCSTTTSSLIANADQWVDVPIDSRSWRRPAQERWDGDIMTFPNTHPRWSYARIEAGPGRRRRREAADQPSTPPPASTTFAAAPTSCRRAERMLLKNASRRRRVLRRAGLQRARPAGPTRRNLSDRRRLRCTASARRKKSSAFRPARTRATASYSAPC